LSWIGRPISEGRDQRGMKERVGFRDCFCVEGTRVIYDYRPNPPSL
jgi:hypothetical protein